jgi:hypothetical protein
VTAAVLDIADPAARKALGDGIDAIRDPIRAHDMCQNDSGPKARGSAPAGPGMLSVADGTAPTSVGIDRQATNVEPAVITMVAWPVADKPGFHKTTRGRWRPGDGGEPST